MQANLIKLIIRLTSFVPHAGKFGLYVRRRLVFLYIWVKSDSDGRRSAGHCGGHLFPEAIFNTGLFTEVVRGQSSQ